MRALMSDDEYTDDEYYAMASQIADLFNEAETMGIAIQAACGQDVERVNVGAYMVTQQWDRHTGTYGSWIVEEMFR